LFYLSITQDLCKSYKAPWLKVKWVSLKVRPEENLCLKASVLKRNESIVATPDPSLIRLGLFAKRLAKGKLGELLTVDNVNFY
jgi:hypothetical protein